MTECRVALFDEVFIAARSPLAVYTTPAKTGIHPDDNCKASRGIKSDKLQCRDSLRSKRLWSDTSWDFGSVAEVATSSTPTKAKAEIERYILV